MPYPLDDNGNIRVDFVWGNVPMQPNEQRGDNYDDNEYTVEGGWVSKKTVGNQALNTGWDHVVRRNGDQSPDGKFRMDITEFGAHDIMDTGYANYPSFLPNYAGDGDQQLELVVPNLTNLTVVAAEALIEGLGLVFSSATSTIGATEDNDGKFKSQTPAAGTVVNPGSTVTVTYYVNEVAVPNIVGMTPQAAQAALVAAGLEIGNNQYSQTGATSGNNQTVKSQNPTSGTLVIPGTLVDIQVYQYVAPVNYNIAGIRAVPGQDQQRYLYLQGRNHNLVFMDQITLQNTGVENYNRPFNVIAIVNDDAFNTGGTKVTITNGIMTAGGGDVTNTGTYTKP